MTPSLDRLISALQALPGVGPKSAYRMAIHLLEKGRESAKELSLSITNALENINHCQRCRNFSESPLCQICSSSKRDNSTLCVVETPSDLMSLEHSGSFNGLYFVLMGHLSPIDGIGPSELGIDALVEICIASQFKEVILATNSTVEGEVTAQYISDTLLKNNIICSRIGYGVPIGGELEYLDANTLKQALLSRKKWS